MGGPEAQEAVEPAIEIGEIGFQGAVGQPVAPPPEGAGALEQALQAGREENVASALIAMTYWTSRIRCARQN